MVFYMESFKKVKGMVGISINVDTETFSASEKRVSICVIWISESFEPTIYFTKIGKYNLLSFYLKKKSKS